jgi:hypothetical protein
MSSFQTERALHYGPEIKIFSINYLSVLFSRAESFMNFATKMSSLASIVAELWSILG